MEALDGNAIAGPLFEYFGAEMTTARGTCTHCGAASQIGELRVYNRAPGSVVRCPNCGSVVIVLVSVYSALRANMECFHLEHLPKEDPPPAARGAAGT
jgi:DNA-directed RNA polymerase subunit RPC12/RpoP